MSNRAAGLVLLVYVLARLLPLAACADLFNYNEEFAKSAAARALTSGIELPWQHLAYMPHEGGGFLVSLLEVVAFALIGPSVLAVKLVAVVFGACILAAVLQLAREHCSPRAAWFVAVAFVLAPDPFVRFSLIPVGTHYEAMLFVALVLLFALRLLRAETGRPRDAILLGLSAGFGLYVSLQMLAALLAVALAFVVRRRFRVATRETGLALGAFVVGALPLWIMLATVGKSVIVIRGEAPVGEGIGPLRAAASLVTPLTSSGDPLVWLHALLFAAVIVLGVAWRERAPRLVALYLAVFALAYSASSLAHEFDPDFVRPFLGVLRHAPLWMFATLLAADGCARLWARGGGARVLSLAAITVAAVAGARDLVGLMRTGKPSAPLENLRLLARTRGWTYPEYLDRIAPRIPGDLVARAAVLRRFDDDPRRSAPEIVRALFEHETFTDARAVELVRAAFGADAPAALRGLGRFLHTNWRYDVPGAFARIDALPPDTREPLAEALGRAGLGPYFRADRLDQQLAFEVPAAHRAAWLRGAGWRVHHVFRFRPDLAEAWLAGRPADEQPGLRAGWNEARALDTLP
jgi:hypothetical protein